MQEGRLNVKRQTFPIEWIAIIPGLNGPQGKNVVGWGSDAQASKIEREQLEKSRRPISAWRCVRCGRLELRAT